MGEGKGKVLSYPIFFLATFSSSTGWSIMRQCLNTDDHLFRKALHGLGRNSEHLTHPTSQLFTLFIVACRVKGFEDLLNLEVLQRP